MSVENGVSDRSAIVCYGSETGNAFDFAEELGRQLERLHFSTNVAKLNAIEPLALTKCTICVFIISTTGQGELPVNARVFWKGLLQKKLSSTYLSGTRFTTFGLGDSSYPKFNWAARKLHTRLKQLGAQEYHHRGEADEQHELGLEGNFVAWALELRKSILVQFPLTDGLEPIPESVLLQPKWLLSQGQASESVIADGLSKGDHKGSMTSNAEAEFKFEAKAMHASKELSSEHHVVKLQENRRLTPQNHWQDVRHLVFHSRTPARYGPGDVLTIYPLNSETDVNQMIELMEWNAFANNLVHFSPTTFPNHNTTNSSPPISISSHSLLTFRHLLTHHLDLNAIPRRSFFSLIAHFTEDQFHKDRLLEFTKSEYIDELYDYTTRPRRSILEVLQEFTSVKIPWQWAAAILPELRGRQFSIASGGVLKQPPNTSTSFELLVAIVKYKTVIKKVREGVCTRYLASLQPGSSIKVSLQRGGLRITKAEAQRPVVMVGPGTGVAPMRSLIWERLQWAKETRANVRVGGTTNIGRNLLFFGCRNRDSDYFYSNEWQNIEKEMPLQVVTAFSRDQNRKVYVQDLIQQYSHDVFHMLHESGGIVYVCGSSGKMPIAVRAALATAFQRGGGLGQAAADRYLEQMEKEGRYKQETW